MENTLGSLFVATYTDAYGATHHVSITLRSWIGNETFYHCLIDGVKEIGIQKVKNKWLDISMRQGELAEQLGFLIDDYLAKR